MVCTNKYLISRLEKKKKMMNLIDENIDIIQDILQIFPTSAVHKGIYLPRDDFVFIA